MAGDLDAGGRYGEVWIALTASDLFVVWSPGTGSRPPEKGGSQACPREEQVERIPLAGVDEVTTEHLVGNGFLVATVRGEARRLCQFTNSHARAFGIFARIAEKVRKGEEVREEDYTDGRPEPFCPRCGRLYPNPDRAICPHCMDRRALTWRVLSFFGEYKAHVAAVIVLMIIGSLLSLISPYINGRILFDEVLTPGGRYEGRILEVILVMAAFSLASIGVSILHARINAHMTAHVIAGVKARVFAAHAAAFDGLFHQQADRRPHDPGQLGRRATCSTSSTTACRISSSTCSRSSGSSSAMLAFELAAGAPGPRSRCRSSSSCS